jgi:hypothetical protein
MDRLLTPARLLLGLLLAALALNHVLAIYLPFPVGTTPMAFEFLEALHFSRLIYVAMGLMLVAGLALLADRFVPLALAAAFYQYFVPSMLAYACVAVLVWALGVLVLRLLQGLLAKPEKGE